MRGRVRLLAGWLISAFCLALLSGATCAQEISSPPLVTERALYVSAAEGDDNWNGLTRVYEGDGWGPKQSINAALDVAGPGDAILVLPGSYNENIELKVGVHLVSEERHGAIIEGAVAVDMGVHWLAGEEPEVPSTTFAGFRVQSGEGTDEAGVGLTVTAAGEVLIMANIISGWHTGLRVVESGEFFPDRQELPEPLGAGVWEWGLAFGWDWALAFEHWLKGELEQAHRAEGPYPDYQTVAVHVVNNTFEDCEVPIHDHTGYLDPWRAVETNAFDRPMLLHTRDLQEPSEPSELTEDAFGAVWMISAAGTPPGGILKGPDIIAFQFTFNIVEYQPVGRTTTFAPSASSATLWVQVAEHAKGCSIVWRFYNPYGELYFTYEGVSSIYNWSWIGVQGRRAASMPGVWRVDVFIDGTLHLRTYFTIT